MSHGLDRSQLPHPIDKVTEMSQDDDKLLEDIERARIENTAPTFTSAMHEHLMARLNAHETARASSMSTPGWLPHITQLVERAFEAVPWLDLSTGALSPSTASSEAMIIKVAPSEEEDFFDQVELRLSLALREGEDVLLVELARPSWARDSWLVLLVGALGEEEALFEKEVCFQDLTEPVMFLTREDLGFSPDRLVCVSLSRALGGGGG